ncbi:hypothetical protein [Neolewinella maritima]|nr:hypothetical protein [Neolewinella maritima]
MSREELKRSGLLDQYVLGLLDPERVAEVERLMEEDPFLEQEVARLRQELNSYADARNIAAPLDGRAPRTAEDFLDLDHEMITAMMERNHSLNLWRYALIAICLLLIGLSGYLFRLKENIRGELVTERAIHAQDEASHLLELRRNREAIQMTVGSWDDMQLFEQPVDTGILHVHLLAGAGVALVDLSDVPALGEGESYYIFGGPAGQSTPEIVSARQQGGLSVIRLEGKMPVLRVYRWMTGREAAPSSGEQPLVSVELPLRD